MDIAETYLQTQVIGIPKVLVHIICAYYEPKLSDLVKRFLERHECLQIPVKLRCATRHLCAATFRIYAPGARCDQCVITFTSHRVSEPFDAYSVKQLMPFTDWDEAELVFPHNAMCWCTTSQPDLRPATRERCEADWRHEWTGFFKRVSYCH
jgi:hypothetical protein